MKKLFLLLIIALLFIACGGQNSNVDLQVAVPVSVEDVKFKSIEEYLTVTGTVSAIQQVELKAETAGFYKLLQNKATGKPYMSGDKVKKEDVIILLNDPELENNTKIESQKLNLEVSEREFEKQQSLYDKGGVTLRELKDAEITFINAKYSYESALLQLSKTKITAPFDGIIVDLPYYTPDVKVTLDTRMVQIMNYSSLYSEISLPVKEISKVKVNQKVRVMNYSVPDDTLWGNVFQSAPALDPDSRSFKASIKIANPELIFRPGMFVKAEIIVAHEDSAIVVPKDIILAQGDEKWVFAVVKGAAERRRITTGIENPLEVQVVQGLKKEERLVVKGFETLRNNSKVKIVK